MDELIIGREPSAGASDGAAMIMDGDQKTFMKEVVEASRTLPVLVDFWATWCGPCKRAVPHNNELAKKYADKGVAVVGACGGGQEERMNAVVDETKMEYPTGKANEQTTKAWGVQWWPHYVVVDRKGKIRAVGIKPDYVEKVIEALMEEDANVH